MKIASKAKIPDSMRAMILYQFDGLPEVQSVPIPHPGKGEILVKVDSSPVNPSDWSFLRGLYSSKKTLPVIPGFEGSGIVVASGDDFLSRRLLGKRVSCFAPSDGNGTWAEYMLTPYNLAVPLKKNIDLEQASMLLVNPLSVMAMIDLAKKRKVAAIANTAAASALGQMLNVFCTKRGIQLVNVVRRQEQVDLLQKLGAKYIVNSSSENFKQEVAEVFKQLDVRMAFDAVSGPLAFDILEALPKGGELIMYGGLSLQNIQADPGKFIFENKRISGFWLSEWVKHQNIFKLLRKFSRIQDFLTDAHHIKIQHRVSLERLGEFLSAYTDQMTSGKIIVRPWDT